ncbi:hypothetical protein BGW41_004261 [Actinomortierella wolfii]|nr:hypothetical protein BGW41_004261 [Actinomortierella wolfii]
MRPYQPASSAPSDTRPTFAPPPPPPLGQKRPVVRPPHVFKPKTLGHLARSTSAEVDNEVAIALASGRSIVSKTDWKEEDAQYLVELIEKQFPKGNIVWDWVGQQMADRGFTKNQCRSKWKRIRTKALLATEYGMKMKDAEEHDNDEEDNEGKSAQKAIMGLTKSLNDFGSMSDRPSSLLFSNRYQNRTASSSERAHRAPPSRPQAPSSHLPGRSGRYYPGQPHEPYDNEGEVDELWSDNEDTRGNAHHYGPPSLYSIPTGATSGLDSRRHEHQYHRHYPSASSGYSRHGSRSEQGTSMPRTIFDYSHEPSSSPHYHSQHHSTQHRPNMHTTSSANEVTVAVATSEGTGVTEEVLSEIAATPTSFGKIEWKAEDSDYLVELIQTKFKSRKVDWGWIAQQMEGRGYDKAQCKSRWWRVQHRSHNRSNSQGANSIGTASSSRGKRPSMSQSDDASVHEDDRPGAAVSMEEGDSKHETKGRDNRQWGTAEYEDIDMGEEPVHPPVQLEEATASLQVHGKSESQRGYRGTTATGTRPAGTGADSPQIPSGPTQKHIEWKEEDSQYMFKMIEREFPVGNIVWSVIAERMASRGYSQTQCMSKWRRHMKSMKKSADEQTGMDIDGTEAGPTYQQPQHRPVERPRGYSHPPSPPHPDGEYDSFRSRKRFNGSEQFQQHAATHFQHPSPYDHTNNSRGVPSHHRSPSGYSHPVEAEFERYYDASGHRRFDSYSADSDRSRIGNNYQYEHARYPSYGSEYAAYADGGRRRTERTWPPNYPDERSDYDYAGRYRPPPPSHGSYSYPPRYPDIESERSRSMDRRRDYHHRYEENHGMNDRYDGRAGSSYRMSPTAGGMVAPAHRGDYRAQDEHDRHRFDHNSEMFAQDDAFNPSKRTKRVQPEDYGPDDYYMPDPREPTAWGARTISRRLSPLPPQSAADVPAEYTTRRPSHSPPAPEQQIQQKSMLPPQHKEHELEDHHKTVSDEPSSQWQSETREEDSQPGKDKLDGEEINKQSNLPLADTTASTPTPSNVQADRSAPSPLSASHPRMLEREQKDMTPEPETSAASSVVPGPRSSRPKTPPVPPSRPGPQPIDYNRPPPPAQTGRSRDHEGYGRERYYNEAEYYAARDSEKGAPAWERDEYSYSPHHYGPPPRRHASSTNTSVPIDDERRHYPHSGSYPHYPPQHSYRIPPPSSSAYRAEDEEFDPRREEWLSRGRYELSDMQQLTAELERQGRKWDTIRREIRIPRLTSPFDGHERPMIADEYPSPPPHHRDYRSSYSPYGNGAPTHPSHVRPHQQYPVPSHHPSALALPQRSGTNGRRRSFDAVNPSGDNPLQSRSFSSHSHPLQHREQPQEYEIYDRHRPPPSSSNGDSGIRSDLKPQFSYSHYGSSPSSHRDQAGGEGPHASKRSRSPDAVEREDEGAYRISSRKQYVMEESSHDKNGDIDGREPSHFQELPRQGQQEEHAQTVQRSFEIKQTNNEAEHRREEHLPEGNRVRNGQQEADLMLQAEHSRTSAAPVNDEQQQQQQRQLTPAPENESEANELSHAEKSQPDNNIGAQIVTPRKDESQAGGDTTNTTVDKDDGRDVKTVDDENIE